MTHNHHLFSARHAAFSLVELSIVLVILGLLTGGVLGGRSLIRAAELRAVTNEFQQWQAATNAFRSQYMALPGDMRNATQFWGENPGCGANGAGSNTTPGYLGGAAMTGTCNGDGNGLVTNNDNAAAYYESFLFWHHLALAGLVPGTYTGVRGESHTNDHVRGENAPASKYGAGGWAAHSQNTTTANVWWVADYGNHFSMGRTRNDGFHNGVMMPEDAWNIDAKMDDGKPGSGMVHGYPHTNTCTNASGPGDYGADYRLDVKNGVCALHFRHAF